MNELPILQSHLNKSRKDKFQLVINIPNIFRSLNIKNVRENDYINLDSMQFSVWAMTLPQVEIPHHSLKYGGQNHNVSSYDRPIYPPSTVNFTIDNEFKNYWFIWKWLNLFNDAKDGTYGEPRVFDLGEYPADDKLIFDYATKITAYSLDEYNNKKVEFVFTNSFITKLGGWNYNMRDPEEIECSFDFVFDQFDVNLI